MLIVKADNSHLEGIKILMSKLKKYREKIFSTENKDFHERKNPKRLIKNIDLKKAIIFVAISSHEEIIGFIEGSIHERKKHKLDKLGYIEELFILKRYRGKGIAKSLITRLEFELKKLNCNHLTAHTDSENTLSQEFYKKSGMKKATIEFWKKI